MEIDKEMTMRDKMDERFIVYSIDREDILREIANIYGIDYEDLSIAIFNRTMGVSSADMDALADHISCNLDMDLPELLAAYEGEAIQNIVYVVREYAKERQE